MIIIFGASFDQATSDVVEWLNYMKANVVRLDTDGDRYQFESLTSTGIFFKDNHTNKTINLLEAKACWWRRQGIGYDSFTYSKSELKEKENIDISSFTKDKNPFLMKEFTRLREFIYHKIYSVSQINLGVPIFDLNRLTVLDLANKSGLLTPDYKIVTNSRQLIEYNSICGKSVSKAISNGLYDTPNGYRFYTYTEAIDTSIYEEKKITFFPSLVTEMIEKKYEIRSFYIDGRFYSMAIFSQTNKQTQVDFRKYADNRNIPYQLPQIIEEKTRRLFKELGLNSGSIDYIVNEKGDYIFLEINPVGQYGMTGFPCNYNLNEIIANYLLYGTTDIKAQQ